MKRFFSLLFLLFFLNCVHAFPRTIARYTVIGATKEGNVSAFMISHFDSSSHAPFATLMIKKAGQEEPLFQDGAYEREGDEQELADLAAYLLEKNADVLQNYKIDRTNQYIAEANMVISDSRPPKIISGWVDKTNGGTKKFTIKSIPSVNCPNNPDAIDLEFWFNGVNQLTAKQKPDSCWENDFSIRNIYQAQKALWFIVNKHAKGHDDLDAYFIDIEGIVLR